MSALGKNNYLLTIFMAGLIGCTTSEFRVLNNGDRGTEILVTSDRVLLECEWIKDADDKDSYGFMMHVLDDKNNAVTIAQGNTLDKFSCDRRLRLIGEILKKGKNIYIASTVLLREPVKTKYVYSFGKNRTSNGYQSDLSFAAIANEFGDCYDAYSGPEKPCPREPFPLPQK
jgi:hypothetical protein